MRPQADTSPLAEVAEKAEKNPADPKVISMQDDQRQAGIVTPQADASPSVVTPGCTATRKSDFGKTDAGKTDAGKSDAGKTGVGKSDVGKSAPNNY